MNILMIGNGFDLEHDLPTSYPKFLKFVVNFRKAYKAANDTPKRLDDIEDEYLKQIFKNHWHEERVNALQFFTNNNLWIDYFQKVYQMHLADKENWIDFEREIGEVIKALDNLIKYYDNVEKGNEENEKIRDSYIRVLIKIIDKNDLNPNKIKKNIPKLLQNLNKLIGALELYIWDYVGSMHFKYYNPDIEKIHPSKVISFNYSDTYRNLYAYDQKEIEYSFIHGFAQNNISGFSGISDISDEQIESYVQTSIEKNNMVLGIDEYLSKDERSQEIDFIAFKKYYQRIYKKTGNEYKKWLKQINENIKAGRKEENMLYIFGHSLDETDGDILREFITHDNLKTVIFYKNKKQLGQQIANLVKVLKSEEVIERVYGNNSTIVFVEQSPREEIEGSSFEIASDTMHLKNIYRWGHIEAKALLAKIKCKVETRDLKYFHSQKAVITLFDVMQKNGLEHLFLKKLLSIAYALMKCEGLQEPIQFNSECWAYLDYDNSFGCDTITCKFVNAINSYNTKHFNMSVVAQSNDEQMKEYEKLIKSQQKIDKDDYIAIIDSVFRMFDSKYGDIDKLWNLLLRLSKGPGENVAKETLEKLISASDDELDIIRYNHLLLEVQMNEYFELEAERLEECYEQADNNVQSVVKDILKSKIYTLNCPLDELAILKLVIENPNITQKEIANKIGKSERTIKNKVASLKEKGYIQRLNGKRNGKWEVLIDFN